ncbi:hypothetical protein CDIK_3782, partial [Cucumispora dikerogammari]
MKLINFPIIDIFSSNISININNNSNNNINNSNNNNNINNNNINIKECYLIVKGCTETTSLYSNNNNNNNNNNILFKMDLSTYNLNMFLIDTGIYKHLKINVYITYTTSSNTSNNNNNILIAEGFINYYTSDTILLSINQKLSSDLLEVIKLLFEKYIINNNELLLLPIGIYLYKTSLLSSVSNDSECGGIDNSDNFIISDNDYNSNNSNISNYNEGTPHPHTQAVTSNNISNNNSNNNNNDYNEGTPPPPPPPPPGGPPQKNFFKKKKKKKIFKKKKKIKKNIENPS